MRDFHRLVDQGFCHVPGILIRRDVADLALQDPCDRAERDVREQLVPDQLLDHGMDAHVETASIKGFFKFGKEAFLVLYEHTDVGIALTAVTDIAHAEHCTVVFCGADDDMIQIDKLTQNILMSRTVLKSQHISVGTDQRLVACQCSLGKKCLDKQDDQIHGLDALCGGDRLGMIQIISSVLLKLESVFIDCRDYIRIGINKVNVIM